MTNKNLISLIAAIALILSLEFMAAFLWPESDKLIKLSFLRICEAIGLLIILRRSDFYLDFEKRGRKEEIKAIKTGLIISFFIGLTVFSTAFILDPYKMSSLKMIRTKFPDENAGLILFIITGALISPITEELFFRGIIFRYFRSTALIPAVLISTGSFALLHPQAGIAQWSGGLIFCLSYEKAKNLLCPLTIHISANLAIFLISLFNAGYFL